MAAPHTSTPTPRPQGQDAHPPETAPETPRTRQATTPANGHTPLAKHPGYVSGDAVEAALSRFRPLIAEGLRAAITAALATTATANALSDEARDLLAEFYAQIEYHLGWRDGDLRPVTAHPGKLMRPALVLLACELAAGQKGSGPTRRMKAVRRAVPAAVAVELVHNFSLVHDDIEDGDEARRHRPTLWKLWGVPRAVNIGDGIFALARMQLWTLPREGVAPVVVLRLASLLDRTCLELCEGQDLDMRFEGRQDVSAAMYLAMIGRKTAALMACAMEMGGLLGSPGDDSLARQLGEFGQRLGLAFQIRDDLLGIWSARELGKSVAGDLRRKKMSLPVIVALEHATPEDHSTLAGIYAEAGTATDEQITQMLAILDRTNARERARQTLHAESDAARAALDAAAASAPTAHEARDALGALLAFVESERI